MEYENKGREGKGETWEVGAWAMANSHFLHYFSIFSCIPLIVCSSLSCNVSTCILLERSNLSPLVAPTVFLLAKYGRIVPVQRV